jgi:hypothetical protein
MLYIELRSFDKGLVRGTKDIGYYWSVPPIYRGGLSISSLFLLHFSANLLINETTISIL